MGRQKEYTVVFTDGESKQYETVSIGENGWVQCMVTGEDTKQTQVFPEHEISEVMMEEVTQDVMITSNVDRWDDVKIHPDGESETL